MIIVPTSYLLSAKSLRSQRCPSVSGPRYFFSVPALVRVAETAPDAGAELLGQQAFLLEEFGLDLGERDGAQADVVGNGGVVGVVAGVVGGVEDVV